MSLPGSKIKEQSRLLDLSSDEESDLQLEIIPNRKKKISRKERNRIAGPKASEPNIGQEVQCALCWAVRGTLLLWLLMLTWICASLYDQVTAMKFDINKVSTKYRVRKSRQVLQSTLCAFKNTFHLEVLESISEWTKIKAVTEVIRTSNRFQSDLAII